MKNQNDLFKSIDTFSDIPSSLWDFYDNKNNDDIIDFNCIDNILNCTNFEIKKKSI